MIKKVIGLLEILPFIYVCGSLEYESRIRVSKNLFVFVYEFFGYGVTSVSLFLCIIGYIVYFRRNMETDTEISSR